MRMTLAVLLLYETSVVSSAKCLSGLKSVPGFLSGKLMLLQRLLGHMMPVMSPDG